MTLKTFTAVLYKEETLYVAECPAVGTVSQGHTIEEGAFQKRGSRSKEQQWQRINEEGVSLRGGQATKQSRSKRLLRFARNDTFSSLGCRHHLGEYLFSGMHPLKRR